MTATVFVDTNILLYSIDENPTSLPKRQRAQQILLNEEWGWSLQVTAEFYVNATSPKRAFRLSPRDALQLIEPWLDFPTVDLTATLFRAAVAIQQRYQLSYWDAAIIAAARQLGCQMLYTEDLNANQIYDGVTVLNPFTTATPTQP